MSDPNGTTANNAAGTAGAPAGNAESIHTVDANGNPVTGTVMGQYDTDSDKDIDTFDLDTNGDGRADMRITDPDEDGTADVLEYDTDGDGVTNVRTEDRNDDSTADKDSNEARERNRRCRDRTSDLHIEV